MDKKLKEVPKTKPLPKPKQSKKEPIFLAMVWPNERGLVKALKRKNINTVVDLARLTDVEILEIPGIQEQRFKKILRLLGRKPAVKE